MRGGDGSAAEGNLCGWGGDREQPASNSPSVLDEVDGGEQVGLGEQEVVQGLRDGEVAEVADEEGDEALERALRDGDVPPPLRRGLAPPHPRRKAADAAGIRGASDKIASSLPLFLFLDFPSSSSSSDAVQSGRRGSETVLTMMLEMGSMRPKQTPASRRGGMSAGVSSTRSRPSAAL